MHGSKAGKKFWRQITPGCKSLKAGKFSGLCQRNWAGMIFLRNVLTNGQGTFAGGAYTLSTVPVGPLGYNWATNYTATASETKFVEVVTPGLFTWNSDGTVTLNTGVFHVGDFTLTVVAPPGDAVGIPEPASLILLGFGGLALGALRRRKAS